jgi:hypothetical protein
LKYARQGSNLQPSVPKTDALSNCATGAHEWIMNCWQEYPQECVF